MKIVHRVLGWLVMLSALWVILSGVDIAYATSGLVQSTEFGMLITITNLVSKIAVVAGLSALWHWMNLSLTD